MKEKIKVMQVRVNPDLHYKIKKAALERGMTVQELMMLMINKEFTIHLSV